MQSFEDFSKFILENSAHNTKDTEQVHIILNYPKIQWDDYAEYMATITWWSHMGWSRNGAQDSIIFAEDLDQALQKANKFKFAKVSYIGTFYYNWDHDRPHQIHDYFNDFCESDKPCQGHILWHPNKLSSYARLHLQCMFLNLDHWRKIGKPSFGKYTGPVIWPERSKSDVHDDYTPHWISPPKDPQIKQVQNQEMAQYISKVIEDGKTIYNFAKERDTKFFCYPERRYCEPLKMEQEKNDNIIYVKNNDTYKDLVHPNTNLTFDVIYAPASGFVAEFLWHQYGHEDTELVIYDYNRDALSWKRMTYEFKENLDSVETYFRKKPNINVDNARYKPEVTISNDEIFPEEKLIETMEKIKSVKFIQHDAIADPISNLQFDENKSKLVFFSNIFCYNFMMHKHKIKDIHDKFNEYQEVKNIIVAGKNPFREFVIMGDLI